MKEYREGQGTASGGVAILLRVPAQKFKAGTKLLGEEDKKVEVEDLEERNSTITIKLQRLASCLLRGFFVVAVVDDRYLRGPVARACANVSS